MAQQIFIKPDPHDTGRVQVAVRTWPRRVEVVVSAPWLAVQGVKRATFATTATSPTQFAAFQKAAEAGYFSLDMATRIEWISLAEGA